MEVVQKKKRSRRKRKLVVDDPKMLATEAIKSQLSDTTDIVNPATLAPPTKRRMKLKITSSVEKLFSTPCCEALSSPIENSLVSNLTHMDIEEEPEIAREEEDVSGIYEQSKCSSVSFAIEEPNVNYYSRGAHRSGSGGE